MLSISAQAQTVTLQQETFDTDGEPSRYTSNTFDLRPKGSADPEVGNGLIQYFVRGTTNPFLNPYSTGTSDYYSFGASVNIITLKNLQGTGFWASESVRGTSGLPSGDRRPAGFVRLNSINTTNYNSLKVIVALASPRGVPNAGAGARGIRKTDAIRIDYSFNNAASWTTIGQFLGDELIGPNENGEWRLDANLNGSASDDRTAATPSPALTQTFQDFTFAIPVSGSSLLVRVVVDARGGSSTELAFDNIRVTGILSNVPPPTLTGIESTTLSYAEGGAAIQLTNTLTAGNPSGSTLTGAKVAISSGFVSGQDVLAFTSANGITGTYTTSTGVLSLTGTASPAAYATALRSVTYRNSNTINATAGSRSIDFTVLDGLNGSPAQTRILAVSSALNLPASLPYSDDLTTDGEGTRYSSNTFIGGNGAAFFRTNIASNPNGQWNSNGETPTTYTNISNNYYWYGGGSTNSTNPAPVRLGLFTTQQVNGANYANLRFKILLGASRNAWETPDYAKIYYRINGGIWVVLASFRSTDQNTPTGVSTTGNLRQDANPANPTGVPTGPQLTPTLTLFDFPLPVAANGQLVDFMIEDASGSADGAGESIAFDLIQVTGTPSNPPVIANQTRSIAENSGNGTVVGAVIAASDPDAGQTLSYAITAGNTNNTFAINAATGQLTVANSAVLNYEVTPSYSLIVQVSDNGTPVLSTTATVTVNVINVNELALSITSQTNVSCNGGANGTATVTATGESAPFTYVWRNTTTSTMLAQTGSAVTGLTAGAYSLTVTATASGFTASTSFSLTQPLALSLTLSSTRVSAADGSNGTASVSVTGGTPGYSYDWTPGTPTGDGTNAIISLSAGSYNVTVTDSKECTAARSLTVTTAPDLTVLLYTTPSTQYGTTTMSVVVEVFELNRTASNGVVTVLISKDPSVVLSFNGTAALVGGKGVQNGSWTFDGTSNPDAYVLATTQALGAGSKLSVGLTGTQTPVTTQGSFTMSATISGLAGDELKMINNMDSDKVEYFKK
ncbi:cadherin repeat domain-containing protein [Spirosoma endophyticum]|nr:cadherin repeat domain-containing protein [Spirosoma endophyticum]